MAPVLNYEINNDQIIFDWINDPYLVDIIGANIILLKNSDNLSHHFKHLSSSDATNNDDGNGGSTSISGPGNQFVTGDIYHAIYSQIYLENGIQYTATSNTITFTFVDTPAAPTLSELIKGDEKLTVIVSSYNQTNVNPSQMDNIFFNIFNTTTDTMSLVSFDAFTDNNLSNSSSDDIILNYSFDVTNLINEDEYTINAYVQNSTGFSSLSNSLNQTPSSYMLTPPSLDSADSGEDQSIDITFSNVTQLSGVTVDSYTPQYKVLNDANWIDVKDTNDNIIEIPFVSGSGVYSYTIDFQTPDLINGTVYEIQLISNGSNIYTSDTGCAGSNIKTAVPFVKTVLDSLTITQNGSDVHVEVNLDQNGTYSPIEIGSLMIYDASLFQLFSQPITFPLGDGIDYNSLTIGENYTYEVFSTVTFVANSDVFKYSTPTITSIVSNTVTSDPIIYIDYSDAPTITSGTAANTEYTITWDEPTYTGNTDITGYNIYVNNVLSNQLGIVYEYTLTGLTNDIEYTIGVSAVNSLGESAISEITAVAYTQISNPLNVTLIQDITIAPSTLSTNILTMSWTAPTVNGDYTITGYKIYDFSNNIMASIIGNTTTYDITGLLPGSYTFKVATVGKYEYDINELPLDTESLKISAVGTTYAPPVISPTVTFSDYNGVVNSLVSFDITSAVAVINIMILVFPDTNLITEYPSIVTTLTPFTFDSNNLTQTYSYNLGYTALTNPSSVYMILAANQYGASVLETIDI